MERGKNYDIIVVGAGPAGCSAAFAASSSGAEKVLAIERHSRIGYPVQCAEFLPMRVVKEMNVPRECIAQDIENMLTFLPGWDEVKTRSPGVILYRDRFDQWLARKAEEKGVELRTGTSLMGFDDEGILIKQRGSSTEKVTSKFVIGADGALSKVGSHVNRRNTEMLSAIQMTVELEEPSLDTEVHFAPEIFGGYIWLFPKGTKANIGLGYRRGKFSDPKGYLLKFIGSLGDRIGKRLKSTQGHIPVGGPLGATEAPFLLAGDAAGHTHPITGGGIHQAVECGRLAGRAAAEYINGKQGAIDEYYKECNSLFGRTLDLGVRKRGEMEERWDVSASDLGAFNELIQRCWVAFKDYYK